jgi:hypothetical protein
MDWKSQPNTGARANMEAADAAERDSRRRHETAQEEAMRNTMRKAERRRRKQEAQRDSAFKESGHRSGRRPAAGGGGPRTAQPQARQWPPPPPPPPTAHGPVQYRGRSADLALLGVRVDTLEGIRSAYKRAALRSHPDKNPAPDAAEEFKRIQAAYERLSAACS